MARAIDTKPRNFIPICGKRITSPRSGVGSAAAGVNDDMALSSLPHAAS
jgi:hypothetical protein